MQSVETVSSNSCWNVQHTLDMKQVGTVMLRQTDTFYKERNILLHSN